MSWQQSLKGDSLSWLLEPDLVNPGPRYFAMRDLLGKSPHDPEVLSARESVMNHGPVPVILGNQHPDGYWVKPGAGYSPKYRGTTWQFMQLAQLGADGSHPRDQRACEYVINHSRSDLEGFSLNANLSGMVHCFQGNMLASLCDLGMGRDIDVKNGLDWLSQSITGEYVAPYSETDHGVRYTEDGNCGPGFACGYNNQLPCAWGAVKKPDGPGQIPPGDAPSHDGGCHPHGG